MAIRRGATYYPKGQRDVYVLFVGSDGEEVARDAADRIFNWVVVYYPPESYNARIARNDRMARLAARELAGIVAAHAILPRVNNGTINEF